MRTGTGAMRAAMLGALLACLAGGSVWAAQGPASDVCRESNKRQACSYQCCGRHSCPPTCEVDCVKACVDACASAQRFDVFLSRLRQLQVRCGNRSLR